MANTLVLYTSKRGSTQQYAEWIAESRDTKCLPLNQVKFEDVVDCDAVVYGGWLRGSGIVGFDKFKKLIPGMEDRVVLFVTGISDYNPANYMQICDINFDSMEDAAKMQLFFCPGRYDVAKVRGLDKIMMKFAKSVLKGGKTPDGAMDAERMVEAIEKGVDKVDIKYTEPVVRAVKKLLAK